jgi:hypothetical protein
MPRAGSGRTAAVSRRAVEEVSFLLVRCLFLAARLGFAPAQILAQRLGEALRPLFVLSRHGAGLGPFGRRSQARLDRGGGARP